MDFAGIETQAVANVLGQIGPESKRVYLSAAKCLSLWLERYGASRLADLDRAGAIAFRDYLASEYRPATAKQYLVVARLLTEETLRGVRQTPFAGVRGFSAIDASPHFALTPEDARRLLAVPDQSTRIGMRNYALLLLLLRTGIRRAECSGLDIGDMAEQSEGILLTIRHAKGNRVDAVKLPADVHAVIWRYLAACERARLPHDTPLFCTFEKGDHPASGRLDGQSIEDVVRAHGRAIGFAAPRPEVTPHCLRVTFNHLARLGGASQEQRQRALRHAAPATTQRYDRYTSRLDDTAVDFIHIL